MIDLALVTDASDEPITTNEAKNYLRIDSDLTDDDDLISMMIKSARLAVEKVCGGLCILPQTWLQSQDFGGSVIDFYKQPVTDVSYVVGVGIDGVRTTIAEGNGYRYTKEELISKNGAFSDAVYELQYTAGKFTATGSVSSDIKMAMLQIVAFWYQNRDQYYELTIPKAVFPMLSHLRVAVSLL